MLPRAARRPGPWLQRAGGALSACCVTLFALTGCVKVDISLNVADDTVSGTMIVAFDKQVLALAGQSGDEVMHRLVPTGSLSTSGVTSQRYDDGQYSGTKITLTKLPLDRLKHSVATVASTGGLLSITHDHAAGRYRLTGTVDLTGKSTSQPSPVLSAGVPGAAKAFLFTIAVTFPGTVTKHNGELHATTVTWHPAWGARTVLHAEAADTSPFPWVAALAIGVPGVLVVLGVLVAIVVLARQRRLETAPLVPSI